MRSNFYFTQVCCPDAKADLAHTATRTLRSYLDVCHWLPACQHSIRCMVSTHPLPNLSFHPHDCKRLSGVGWPNIAALPASWHRLQMHRVTQGPLTPAPRLPSRPPPCRQHTPSPGHLVPLEQVPFIHRSHLQDTALRWGFRTGFTAPDHTSSPRSRQQRVIWCPGPSPRGIEEPTRRSCSESAHTRDVERLGLSREQTNRDVHNKLCVLRQIVTLRVPDKEECRGKAQPGNQSLCLVCWRRIDLSPGQTSSRKNPHQSFLCQSMLGWKKSPGRSSWEQKMKAQIWLMTFQWTLAL